MENLTASVLAYHPYNPSGLTLADYLGNELSVPVLLGIFAGGCASIVVTTRFLVQSVYPLLQRTEKAAVWWFILCELHPSIVMIQLHHEAT